MGLRTFWNRKLLARVDELEAKLNKLLALAKESRQADAKFDQLLALAKESRRVESKIDELLWATVFNSATAEKAPLSLSPGRWAVGYQYLYVAYRALEQFQPRSILDLGLGQSTRLIAAYAKADPEVRHVVVEHDERWIEFFRREYELPANSEIVRLGLAFRDYQGADGIRVFEGFRDAFAGQKFDLISIDAQFGGDMKDFARIDVLEMLPDILSDSYVLLLDDAERSGERHTIERLKEIMEQNGRPMLTGLYRGQKHLFVAVSPDNSFLLSM